MEVLGRMRRQREPPVTLDYLGYLKVRRMKGRLVKSL